MDVNITVEFGDDAKKLIAGFVNALTEASDKKPAKKTRAKSNAKAEKTEAAEPTPEPAAPVTPEPAAPATPEPAAPAATPPVISMEELRDAAKAFIGANGRDGLQGLLTEFEAPSITGLDVEKYDAFYARLTAPATDAPAAGDSLL